MKSYRLFKVLGLGLPLAFAIMWLNPAQAVEQRFFISVPILGVLDQNGKKVGAIQYLAVQIDRLPHKIGPEIQFNEGSRALGRFKGGALSPDWKEAAHTAVVAASRALDDDPRTWLVTIKNVGNAYLTDGPSASAALAVAILAAFRGDSLLSGTGMTGALEADGRISHVGAVPEKIQGAATGGLSTVLIPQGQSRTAEWDIRALSENLHVRVIEVRTLREAYEGMTGRSF